MRGRFARACAVFQYRRIPCQRPPTPDPAACSGDIGHYCIRIALFAFGWERAPASVSAVAHAYAGGNPSDATATLYYDPVDGDSDVVPHATFTCSFHSALRQTVEIAGTRGTLSLDDFVLNRTPECSFSVLIDPATVEFDHQVRSESKRVLVDTPRGHQESALWARFAALIRGGKIDSFWPRIAMQTQAVQVGAVVYSAAETSA